MHGADFSDPFVAFWRVGGRSVVTTTRVATGPTSATAQALTYSVLLTRAGSAGGGELERQLRKRRVVLDGAPHITFPPAGRLVHGDNHTESGEPQLSSAISRSSVGGEVTAIVSPNGHWLFSLFSSVP
jgi:hypothetical protein